MRILSCDTYAPSLHTLTEYVCDTKTVTCRCNRLHPNSVIPAKAGIQISCASMNTQIHWIPAFAGMTTVFCHHWSDCISHGGLNGYVESDLAMVISWLRLRSEITLAAHDAWFALRTCSPQ